MDLKLFSVLFQYFFERYWWIYKACLNVELKNPLTEKKTTKAYFLSGNDLIFELTSFAIAEGFQKDNIIYLGTQWLRISHLMHFFNAYEKQLSYLNKFIFFFRFLSWLAIIYMYDFSNTYYSLSNWKFLVILRSFSNTPIRLAPPPSTKRSLFN